MEEILHRIEYHLERLRIVEYLENQRNLKRSLIVHFLHGIMRGLGFAFGFSVLGAIVIAILRKLLIGSVPGMQEFLADMIRAAESRL